MYAQLGNIIFESNFDLQSFSRSSEAVYAESARISGKPTLQRLGSKLDEVSVSIRLRQEFCQPETVVAQLEAYRNSSEILPFLTGAGDVLGDFVIVSIQETAEKWNADGSIMQSNVSLSLKEFSSPNVTSRREFAARSNAFALSNNNPETATPTNARQAIEYQGAENVMQSSAEVKVAHNTELPKATIYPDQETHWRKRISKRMQTVLIKATAARGFINATTGQIYTDTRDLDTTLADLISKAGTLSTLALSAASLADVITQSGDVSTANLQALKDANKLAKFVGGRR